MPDFNSSPDTAAEPSTAVDRTQEQRNSVLKQLQEQLQFARVKGDSHEVARLQEQIDDINSGPADHPAPEPTSQGGSVADIVGNYQQKASTDTDGDGVTDNLDAPDPSAAPSTPAFPTSSGSMYETTTTVPGGLPASADVPSAGPAPKFKSPYVAPDRSGISSIQDLLAADQTSRTGARDKTDSEAAAALSKLDASDTGIKDEYGRKKNINEWADVGQTLAHALTQYGAARQGLNTNVDMSGLKFDKVDYSKKVDQLMEEMKQDLNQNKDKRGMAERKREHDLSFDRDTADRYLGANLSGRSEEEKNREQDAAAQGAGIENENRFNQENYRTKESAAARVEAAKQRVQTAETNREKIAADKALALAEAQRKEAQRRQDKLDEETRKADAKATETKTNALAAVQSGVELIGDRKTAVKGESQVAAGLSKLGVSKKDQDEVIELSKPNGLLEFGDSKKKKLYEKLQAIQADIDSGKRTKASGAGTQGDEGNANPPGQPPSPPVLSTGGMTPADTQALQWAKSNPQDPRAAAIMQRLGGR